MFLRDYFWTKKTSMQNYLHCKTFSQLKQAFATENKCDWRSEYVRLSDRVPKFKFQQLSGHADEVLHVAVSGDGKDIASCSKDQCLNIWRRKGQEYDLIQTVNMDCYEWQVTSAVYFSQDDKKLLVVNDASPGELAVFKRGKKYEMICLTGTRIGCWCGNDFFVTSSIATDRSVLFWLCGLAYMPSSSAPFNRPIAPWYKRLLFTFRMTVGVETFIELRCFTKPKTAPSVSGDPSGRKSILEPSPFVTSTEDDERRIRNLVRNENVYLALACNVDRTPVPHQIGFKDITASLLDPSHSDDISRFDVVLEMHAQVVGITIDDQHEFLYANVRSWPDSLNQTTFHEPPPISNQLETRIVSLDTFTVLKKVHYKTISKPVAFSHNFETAILSGLRWAFGFHCV